MKPSPRLLLAGLTTLCLATPGAADVDGGPNVKRLGATVMRWKDETLQVIVGYQNASH